MTRHPVLINSSDPLAGALLGASVELAGHQPHFARKGETARNALRRVRPALVLIDCEHEESCADEFIGPALMMQSRVVLFRSPRGIRDTSELVHRLDLRVISLPEDYDQLNGVLAELGSGT